MRATDQGLSETRAIFRMGCKGRASMDLERLRESDSWWKNNIIYFIKWMILSSIIGLAVGTVGACFSKSIELATAVWTNDHRAVLFMPLSGIIIVSLYKLMHEEKHKGTNLVIESISADSDITLKTAPLIFISTFLTHIVGGSSGREGAALQLGGSLGNFFARLIRLDASDKKIAIMCSMSACFSALFGTPLAAAVFSMEVISVGVMLYSALIPCIVASFVGMAVAGHMGVADESFIVSGSYALNLSSAAYVIILGICAAIVSILFCVVMHRTEHIYQRLFPNTYIRITVGSILFIALTLIEGSFDYNGGGFPLVRRAMAGDIRPYAFLLKILFTAVALGAGFKGGEIVPTFCIGACLGGAFAGLLGLDCPIYTACGMVALFAGVTNCPVTSILMAFDLFGYDGMPYYAVAIAVSFTLSGYYGLYKSQRFRVSKLRTGFIDKK